VRFVLTNDGENLTALASRLFCVETKEQVAGARRRLLELNPGLPDRKTIPPGTVVLVPEDVDGEPAREGRSLGDVTAGALAGFQKVLSGLDETLARHAREESARHAAEQKLLGDAQLRRAARESPELAARLGKVGEAIAGRQQRTKELQQFAKAATREIGEDLAALAELTGKLLPG
jgi:hypothetical protein